MKVNRRNGLYFIAVTALLQGATALFAPVFAACQEPAAERSDDRAGEENSIVESIRVVTEGGKVLQDPATGIPLQTGKPLDKNQVAASIRVLFQSGDYADIRAVQEPLSGGVRVDFVVRENLYFNLVTVQGLKPPPSEASAAASMQISLGQVYRQETLDEGLQRLTALLQEEGLYEARIETKKVPHPESHEMDIVVKIRQGARARVSSVQLTNNTEYPNDQILAKLKVERGKELRRSEERRVGKAWRERRSRD